MLSSTCSTSSTRTTTRSLPKGCYQKHARALPGAEPARPIPDPGRAGCGLCPGFRAPPAPLLRENRARSKPWRRSSFPFPRTAAAMANATSAPSPCTKAAPCAGAARGRSLLRPNSSPAARISKAISRISAVRPPICTASNARRNLTDGSCPKKRCLHPEICPVLKIDHRPQIELLRRVRRIKGVKKAFVASGIRYDMLLQDQACGTQYLEEVVEHHVSGQMKVAPEHTEDSVLSKMGKPGKASLGCFQRACSTSFPARRAKSSS